MTRLIKAKMRHWLAKSLANPRQGYSRPLPLTADVWSVTVLKLDGIGDFVLSTAALNALRDAFPSASFTLIVRVPVAEIARQQFENWDVVELPARESALRNIVAQPGVRRRLAALPIADLLVDLRAYRDYSDTVVASWVPARYRVGVCNAFPDSFNGIRFPKEEYVYDELAPREPPQHGECFDIAGQRALMNHVLRRVVQLRPRLSVPGAACRFSRNTLHRRFGISGGDPYVLVFPGTSSPIKEIPASQLAQGILGGLESVGLIPIVVGGSVADARTTIPLIAELSRCRPVHDASGLFSLAQNVGLIAGARMLVGMDSCHIHMAGALSVPAVGILGGGQFGDFAPWGESDLFRWVSHRTECYGCHWICPYSKAICLHSIPPGTIAEAIRGVLSASADLRHDR